MNSPESAKIYKVALQGSSGTKLVNILNEAANFFHQRSVILLPGSTDGGVADSTYNAVNVVFSLIGSPKKLIGGYIGADQLQFYTMTYDHPYPEDKTTKNVELLTAAPFNYVSNDAWAMIDFLSPNFAANMERFPEGKISGNRLSLEKVRGNFSRLTFYGKSKGTLVYREIENGIAYCMAQIGYSPNEINLALGELFCVGIANLFITEQDGRRANGVYFVANTDKKSAKYCPGITSLLHNHEGDYSTHPRSQNDLRDGPKELHVVVSIPPKLELLGEDGKVYAHNDPTVHSAKSYIGKRIGGERENMIPLMVANSLTHGIVREPSEFNNRLMESVLFERLSLKKVVNRLSWTDRSRKTAKRTALIWVESLVGAGHLAYAGGIAQELVKRDFSVTIVTGSRKEKDPDMNIEGVQIIDLPASKGDFANGRVQTENGLTFDEDGDWRKQYTDALLDSLHQTQPDVVITEFWPIKRGDYDFAMLRFLERVSFLENSPNLYCLVRDYVDMSVTNTAARGNNKEAVNILNRFYNGVLAHTHKSLMRLEDSFPEASTLKSDIRYIGYITNLAPCLENKERKNVLVTSGGGWMSYCEETTRAAIRSAVTYCQQENWYIFVPHDVPSEILQELELEAKLKSNFEGQIKVSKNSPHFKELLTSAHTVITHGGNTIIEALNSGVPHVVVAPRTKVGDIIVDPDSSVSWSISPSASNEQLVRAVRFANAGYITLARPEDLPNLSEVLKSSKRAELDVRKSRQLFNGARNAADIIETGLSQQVAR